ncbi:MAG: hypothetical protein MJ010_01945 [Paludibacteraceae bacterium]|nr:hypothetical protein [Paludibacteraceae bacterium]
MIFIANKRLGIDKIRKKYPDADILDITSTSDLKYTQLLSPFYPHMNIPIPNSKGLTASCVEAIWQGLKVFENFDVDINTFKNVSMHNIKRTTKKFGKILGHRYGVGSNVILNYFDARMLIYIPTYKYVLDNIPSVHNILSKIRDMSFYKNIVLLDYNVCTDYRDITKPISHAYLVKCYIEDCYPKYSKNLKPLSKEELKNLKSKERELKNKFKQKTIAQQLQLNLDFESIKPDFNI